MTQAQRDIEQLRMSATLALDEAVDKVRLVSPARAKALAGLGIFTVRDLLHHFPRRYIDLSSKETVRSARIGENCTIEGIIHDIRLKRPKPKLQLVEIDLVDETGILLITAFRQPWLMDSLSKGMRLAVAGKLEFNFGYKRMTNPFIEVLGDVNDAAGMVIPVHPATEKISTAWMRRLITNALEKTVGLYDPLPVDLRIKRKLMSKETALARIHFPQNILQAQQARQRLAYEEILNLELFLIRNSKEREEGKTPVQHNVQGKFMHALEAVLPFALTGEQAAARDDILREMAANKVMNHLLLGDVGTGKTVVAAHAVAAVADSGGQALFMVPTEVLAQQHCKSLGQLFDAAGIISEVVTGSTPASEKAAIAERFAAGTIDVLIGTHALLEEGIVPKNLTLVIIDEQQRFGVDQRARLLEKGEAPDALYLTATPIPRSLALALFGNLTLSYIKEKPYQTPPRKTKVYSKEHRGFAYDAAKEALARGEQVYVVCPLVGKSTEERNSKAVGKKLFEEAEDDALYPAISIENDADLQEDNIAAASKEAAFLQEHVFVDYTVELLHGKMPASEKQAVMERFRSGEVQVLVATTVIEVGVDVPQATVMIIEDADRFGLSQLHQLRGRVGRGSLPGEVYLISAAKNEVALSRLAAMESSDDGYELAAFDLSLRREGDILGNRQHGVSALKLVNVVRDGELIEMAHADAVDLLEKDPELAAPEHRALAREVRLLFKDETVKGG